MTLDDNFININTRRVTEIDADLPDGKDFVTYCDELITDRLNGFFYILWRSFCRKMFSDSCRRLPNHRSLFHKKHLKLILRGTKGLDPAESEMIDVLAQSVPSAFAFIELLVDRSDATG